MRFDEDVRGITIDIQKQLIMVFPHQCWLASKTGAVT